MKDVFELIASEKSKKEVVLDEIHIGQQISNASELLRSFIMLAQSDPYDESLKEDIEEQKKVLRQLRDDLKRAKSSRQTCTSTRSSASAAPEPARHGDGNQTVTNDAEDLTSSHSSTIITPIEDLTLPDVPQHGENWVRGPTGMPIPRDP